VRPDAVRERLDQRSPLPGRARSHRVPRRPCGRQHVVAVDADPGGRTRRPSPQRPGGRCSSTDGSGVPCLAEKTTGSRKTPVSSSTREIPRGGPPSPEGGEDGDPLSAHLRSVRRPDGVGKLRGTGEETRHQVDRAVAPMVRHLPPRVTSVVFPRICPTSGGERYPRINPPRVRYAGKIPVPSRTACPPDRARLLAVDGTKSRSADVEGDSLLVDRPHSTMCGRGRGAPDRQCRIERRIDRPVRSKDRHDSALS